MTTEALDSLLIVGEAPGPRTDPGSPLAARPGTRRKRSRSRVVIGVDTGVREAGFAVLCARRRVVITCGVIKPTGVPRDAAFHLRVADMATRLREQATHNSCAWAYVEMPTFWVGSAKGAAAAEDVAQLAYAAGAFVCTLGALHGTVAAPVYVRDWKGQASKATVNARLARAFGEVAEDGTPIRSHAWDAVGLAWCGAGGSMNDKIFAK